MTPNEKKALAEIMFALTGPHTPEEIAEHIGIDPRSVRRIEARALSKLRGWLDAKEDWQEGLREPLILSQRKMDRETGGDLSPMPWDGMTRRRITGE